MSICCVYIDMYVISHSWNLMCKLCSVNPVLHNTPALFEAPNKTYSHLCIKLLPFLKLLMGFFIHSFSSSTNFYSACILPI